MNDVATISALPQVSETTALVHMIERVARDPSVDIDKLHRLMEMRERLAAKEAERAFDRAMTQAQGEMRPVSKDSSNTQTRSRYASYLALDQALRPIYIKHGFSLTFNTGDAPHAGDLRVLCRVGHDAGHSVEYRIDMPADGKGAKGGDVMTRTHATGSAATYGRRYLLTMIFNITSGESDDDGNAAGLRQNPHVTRVEDIVDPPTGETIPDGHSSIKVLPKGSTRAEFERAQKEMYAITSEDNLAAWAKANANRFQIFHPDYKDTLRGLFAAHRESLRQLGANDKPKDAPAVQTTSPAAALDWIDKAAAKFTTMDAFSPWWTDTISPRTDYWPQEDQDEAIEIFRKHQVRIEGGAS
jgi:hypothetical protein